MIKKAENSFATAYLLLIFAVYPFYMENGYVDIGEGKYNFFLYCSLGALGILAALGFVRAVQTVIWRCQAKEAYLVDWNKISLSSTDLFVFLYIAVISVSSLLSDFRQEALWGTTGWHMGFIMFGILAALYLLLSRMWDGKRLVWIVAVAASAVVFVLGILDSFSIYLISLDIRESGFISTLGNINWFCGYLSVVGPVGICLFLFQENASEEKKVKFINWKRMVCGGYVVITFMAGLTQGSNSVFLWFGGLFFVLLWIAVGKRKWLQNWFLLLFLWGASAQLVRLMRYLLPGMYNYELNNLCGYFTGTNLTLWIAGIGAVCYGVLAWRGRESKKDAEFEKEEIFGEEAVVEVCEDEAEAGEAKGVSEEYSKQKKKEIRGIRIFLFVVLAAVILLWIVLSALNTWTSLSGFVDAGLFLWNENWGNGRGAALKASLQMFREMSFSQKLLGIGPDCFVSYAYTLPDVMEGLREYFGSSRLTNAHCEVVNSLVNVGVVGTLCYLGIFVSFIIRCFQKGVEKPVFYIPAVCVICYLCHNVVSFAQVLNIPFVFLLMGMGERMLRDRKIKIT